MPGAPIPVTEMMNTREVAQYLRVKERKVYDLVRKRRIPCTRVTGKWLFPKPLIDLWMARNTEAPGLGPGALAPPPAVAVGSHDPLLEWALRESRSGLAHMAGGSLDGLKRLAEGQAAMCGLHVYDAESGGYNAPVVAKACAGLDVVLLEWAWREQGLVLAEGNPLGIGRLPDLAAKKARLVGRQAEAGSQLLLLHLLVEAGIALAELTLLEQPALSETDLGLAVLEGRADAGLAVAAVARQFRLDFLPLHRERYDLLLRQREYFEEPAQKLFAFARGEAFRVRAREMTGYDVSGLGRVVYNAP